MLTTRLASLGRTCRTVAAALIAGFQRGTEAETVEARLCALPLRDQVQIVGTTLGALFAVSLLAGQFGLPGLLVMMLAVILLVR